MHPVIQLALDASLGDETRWGPALRQGPGRVRLLLDPPGGALAIAAADAPVPPGAVVLLEHDPAHPLDAVDWSAVHARYQAAVFAASEGLGVGAEAAVAADGPLIDVRRAPVYQQAPNTLPGAVWRDPARVADWGTALARGEAVTVYCVYGHEVSRAVVLRLRAAGVDARFLDGGIDAWAAAGRPVVAKT